MAEGKVLEGLGGWLILVGIGIVLAPVRICVLLVPAYHEMFSSGTWQALTTPGTPAYDPLWQPLIIGEMTVNGLLVLAWIFIAFLFFSKKAVFPSVYIAATLFTLAFIVVDALAFKMVTPDKPLFDPETTTELARSLIRAGIWVPYMMVSKRVRVTFVN